jgi:Ca2+-binding EF-hand superfamily protein
MRRSQSGRRWLACDIDSVNSIGTHCDMKRIPKKRYSISRYVLLCLLMIPCELLHTPPSMGAMNADDEYEIQDLICLSAGEPGFVRLRIRVDESGLYTRRRAYALKLFDTLDVSRDGVLDAAECRLIPPAGHLIAFHHGVSDAAVPQFGAPDTDGNGLVTPEEFSGWILAVAGPCLRINIDAPQFSDDQPVPLFERLDQNHDSQLTPEELAETVRRLRTLDSDLDGRIAPDEIRSPDVIDVVEPDNAATRESLAALALLEPINRYSVGDALLRKIIQKYDKLARGISARRFVKDGRLSANELGLQPDALETSDQNGDLLLDQKELRNFLTHLQPAHELLIDFGSESTRPRIEILQQSDTSQATSLTLEKNSNGDVVLRLGRNHFELAMNPWPREDKLLEEFSRDFENLDSDSNGLLDPSELPEAGHFRIMDTDGDEQVIEKEFNSLLDRQRELQEHVVSLELRGGDHSLFNIADSSGNGSLEYHELTTLPARVNEMDQNKDGIISADELPRGYQLVFSRSNGPETHLRPDSPVP